MTASPCPNCGAPFVLVSPEPKPAWECVHEVGCPGSETVVHVVPIGWEPYATYDAVVGSDGLVSLAAPAPFVPYGLGPRSLTGENGTGR